MREYFTVMDRTLGHQGFDKDTVIKNLSPLLYSCMLTESDSL